MSERGTIMRRKDIRCIQWHLFLLIINSIFKLFILILKQIFLWNQLIWTPLWLFLMAKSIYIHSPSIKLPLSLPLVTKIISNLNYYYYSHCRNQANEWTSRKKEENFKVIECVWVNVQKRVSLPEFTWNVKELFLQITPTFKFKYFNAKLCLQI